MLRTETVRPELLARLRELMKIPELSQFYLVGGTGLSLIYGHRHSDDIDLFTHQAFEASEVLEIIQKRLQDVEPDRLSEIFLFVHIAGIKVDFVNSLTPLQFPIKEFDGVRIADERDIAGLKLKAIFQRGSKKDFIDLYQLLKHFSVEELLVFFSAKYPKINIGQLLISMQYFDDAEKFQMPYLHINTNWDKIKNSITKKVVDYLKTIS